MILQAFPASRPSAKAIPIPLPFQAIVGSMAVGDVFVTASFMLMLAATLIVGNIIADILLAVLDPRIRTGGAKG